MMNRMMKAEAFFMAQALENACVILRAVSIEPGGCRNQDYKRS